MHYLVLADQVAQVMKTTATTMGMITAMMIEAFFSAGYEYEFSCRLVIEVQ